MDRDPGDFQSDQLRRSVADLTDDEFDAWMARLPPAPGIRHIDDEDPEEDARIEADIAAGRVHDHAVVSEWLRTWGKPGYKPFKEWLAARNG